MISRCVTETVRLLSTDKLILVSHKQHVCDCVGDTSVKQRHDGDPEMTFYLWSSGSGYCSSEIRVPSVSGWIHLTESQHGCQNCSETRKAC